MENLNVIDRRKFLVKTSSIIGIGLFAGTFSAFLASCEKSATMPTSPPATSGTTDVSLASNPELQNVNGFKKITFQGKNENMPVIFIRKSNTDFTVLSSKCGHQGCEVNNPDIAKGRIDCLCHGSGYDLNGNILNGPTTRALQSFASTFDSNKNVLTVTI